MNESPFKDSFLIALFGRKRKAQPQTQIRQKRKMQQYDHVKSVFTAKFILMDENDEINVENKRAIKERRPFQIQKIRIAI